jgi:hypothetical protein
MKKLLKLSSVLLLSTAMFTACDDDDDGPINPIDNTDPTVTYVTFDAGSYWIYESNEYDDENPQIGETTRDSTVVDVKLLFAQRTATKYNTYEMNADGSYPADPTAIDYYSEEEGNIWVYSDVINSRLSIDEFEDLDLSIPDGWLQIRDIGANGEWTLQTVNLQDFTVPLEGFGEASISNGTLSLKARNLGTDNFTLNGAEFPVIKQEISFELNGEGTFLGQPAGTITGSTRYEMWFSEDYGLVQTNFMPFGVRSSIIDPESDIYTQPGTLTSAVDAQVVLSDD